MSLPVPHSAADSLSRLNPPAAPLTLTRLSDAMVFASWETAIGRWDRHHLRDAARELTLGRYVTAQTFVVGMQPSVVRDTFLALVNAFVCGHHGRVEETLSALERVYDFGRALAIATGEVVS